MCLAILCLTVLTAAGDEQFEESPDQCITSEHSHLNWVINQEVKYKAHVNYSANTNTLYYYTVVDRKKVDYCIILVMMIKVSILLQS
jgi:hypothetical protein